MLRLFNSKSLIAFYFIVVIVGFCPAALFAATNHSAPETKHTNQWYYSMNFCFSPGRVYAVSPNSLWLGGCGWVRELTRVDLATGKNTMYTSMDGLPLENQSIWRVTAAPDDRCAILTDQTRQVYLWHPKAGWGELPSLSNGRRFTDIAFDENGTLVALTCSKSGDRNFGDTLFEFREGRWKYRRKTPLARRVIPLKKGYALMVYNRETRKCRCIYLPAEVSGKVKDLGPLPPRLKWFYIRMGGKTYLCDALHPFRSVTINSQRWGIGAVRELTPEGLGRPIGKGIVGIDFQRKRFVPVAITTTADKKDICTIKVFGNLTVRLDGIGGLVLPVRGLNGTVWARGRWWDGKQWHERTITPELLPSTHAVLERTQYRFNPITRCWRRVVPKWPADVKCYDSKTRRAWIITAWEKGELQYVQFDETGRAKVLRRFPFEQYWGMPSFRTKGGDWWGSCHKDGRSGVFRIAPNGKVHVYPLKDASGVHVSPKGTIWMRTDKSEHRYNPKTDKFEDNVGLPWDDFAFRIGRYHLSIIPAGIGCCSLVKQKINGRWENFRIDDKRRYLTYAGPYFRHGDRLLVWMSVLGVMEYDGTKDRWIRLQNRYFHIGFDLKGRRILANNIILVYDGDPFESPLAARNKTSASEAALFNKLLKLMDDDNWRVREKATTRMKELSCIMCKRILAARDNENLSLEVRLRIKSIFPKNGMSLLPPCLFRKRYPLVGPVKKTTTQRGRDGS